MQLTYNKTEDRSDLTGKMLNSLNKN